MADLNALIAQGVQFKQPESPLNMMAQLQQLQSSQNQNALAQYQLGAAQRADVSKTAINQAYANAVDLVTGKIDYAKLTGALATGGGSAEIPGLLKQKREGEKAASEAAKSELELVDSKLKQSRSLLDTVNTPDAYLAWHEANHADPVLGPVLAARGITADKARAQIQAALQQPGGFEQLLNQSKLGTEKFMEMNKAQLTSQDIGGTGRVISTPGLGGPATIVPGSTFTKTATPGELLTAKTALAGQKVTERGQDIGAATASKRLAFDQTKFNWEKANPGFDLIQDAEGGYLAVNKKNKNDITPLMMAAPPAAGAAPGARGAINVTDGGRPPMVPVKGKPAQMPAKFTETDMQLSGLAGSLKEFKDEVKKDLGTTAKWLPSGSDTARMNAKYTALLMGVKDLYTLGALTGPDMSIIESQLTNPASWSGKFTSKKGFDEQVQVIENMLKRSAKNLENNYGRAPKATQEALKSTLNEVSDTNPLGIPGR